MLPFFSACQYGSELNPDHRTGEVLSAYQQHGDPQAAASGLVAIADAGAIAESAAILVLWSLDHIRLFERLLEVIGDPRLLTAYADEAVKMGKSFVLQERLNGDHAASAAVVERIRHLEFADHRKKVAAASMPPSSPLHRVLRLQGDDGENRWQGAALLVAESYCRAALLTAAHNIYDFNGRQRAPLTQIRVELGGNRLAIAEVAAYGSAEIKKGNSIEPEHDWAILLLEKPYCGGRAMRSDMVFFDQGSLAQDSGLPVKLMCFHQGRADVVPHLYRESCRLYQPGAAVLDHYAAKAGKPLGIHSCVSEAGSSGCSLFVEKEGQFRFLGTQIEGDSVTGAGIARIFSGDYRQAFMRINEQFAADDQAYRERHSYLGGTVN